MAVSIIDQNRVFKQCLHDFRVNDERKFYDNVDEDWFRENRARILAIFGELLNSDEVRKDTLKTSITNLFDFISYLFYKFIVIPERENHDFVQSSIITMLTNLKSDLESGVWILGSSEDIQKAHPALEWGTAGTIITSDASRANDADRVIVTRHASAIVWLVGRLRAIYLDDPDFYQPNVETAIEYLEEKGEDNFNLMDLANRMIVQSLNILEHRIRYDAW